MNDNLRYNFENDNFLIYENVDLPKKVEMQLPLDNSPMDISDWAESVNPKTGEIIAKNKITFDSNPEIAPNGKYTINNIPPQQQQNVPQQQQDITGWQQNTARQNLTGSEWVTALANAYRKIGVSENGIKNLIAKNALESGWGKSVQGRFNYGNITTGSSWKGNYVNGHDKDANGNPIRSKFRSYNSIEEFARDEVDFLRRLYDFDDNDNIDTFINKLQGGNSGKRHYAEARDYKQKVKSVYKKL